MRIWKRHHSRAKLENLSEALRKLGRKDVIKEIELELEGMDQRFAGGKRRDSIEIDVRKRDAEALHQKLLRFFDKRKAQQAEDEKNGENGDENGVGTQQSTLMRIRNRQKRILEEKKKTKLF